MVTQKITLNNPERFEAPHEIPREKIEKAAKAATDKLKAMAQAHGYGFPRTSSKDYKYNRLENDNWECGMYTGCFWLAYELTGDKFFREVAESQLASYKRRIDEKIGMDDHDVGFVFTPSCVAAYKITGNETAKAYALEAVDYYYNTSYSHKGKFIIRVHKARNNTSGCRTMMDSLMNAPFLFWSGKVTGNEEYFKAAHDHTLTTVKYLLRDDASTFHHYMFEPGPETPVRGLTLQGNSDDSCWSRGHSWGIYGLPIAYSYTGDEVLREAHRNITLFMLNHLPEDMIPYWDYDFVDGDEPRDSSAGAISVCGLNEMCKMLPDDSADKALYTSAANQMLEAIIDNCTGDIGVDYEGLICHVTHAKPQKQGIDECAVYGDYFYLEALLRYLNPEWKKYW